MVVRELITKISFAVNKGGLSTANNAISRLKAGMGGIGSASSLASRIFGNNAANMAASATKVNMGISRIKSSISGLTGALGPLAGAMTAAFSIKAIQNTADEMMGLDGRLRSVTSSEEERRGVESQLYELSQNNRSSLAEMGDLYFSTARACKQMGRSQEDAMRTTDIVSKALTLGGATTDQAKASILQLGQALGSGVLQGDELHSLDENASLLMQHMAESMGVPQSALKKMGADGVLTSQMVMDAILASGDAIDNEFKGIPLTIGQALTQASNSWKFFILRIEHGTGIFSNIAQSLSQVFREISTDMNDIVTIMSGPGDSAESMAAFEQAKAAHPYIVAIADAFQKVYDIIDQIGQATGIDNLIAKAVLLAGGIAVVAGVFAAISSVAGMVAGVVSGLFGVISGVVGFLLAAGWPVIAAIAAVGAAIYFVKEHWDSVVAAFSPGIEMMQQGLAAFSDAWQALQPVIEALMPILGAVAEVVGGTLVEVASWFFSAFAWAFRAVAAIIDVVAKVLKELLNTGEWVLNTLSGLVDSVRSAFDRLGQIIRACGDWISSLIDKAKSFLGMSGEIRSEGSALQSFAQQVVNVGGNNSNNTSYTFNVGSAQDAIGVSSSLGISAWG